MMAASLVSYPPQISASLERISYRSSSIPSHSVRNCPWSLSLGSCSSGHFLASFAQLSSFKVSMKIATLSSPNQRLLRS